MRLVLGGHSDSWARVIERMSLDVTLFHLRKLQLTRAESGSSDRPHGLNPDFLYKITTKLVQIRMEITVGYANFTN